MGADWQGPNTSRRDFLGFFGGALGGVALTRGTVFAKSIGGGGRGDRVPWASAAAQRYRFFNVLTPGVTDFGLPLGAVSGGVMINDHSQIVFHAQNTSGGFGMYELTMDYAGDAPVVAGVRTIVQQGDTLPGGRTVDSIRRGVSNAEGSFAAVIQTEETPSVYLQRKNEAVRADHRVPGPRARASRGSWGASCQGLRCVLRQPSRLIPVEGQRFCPP